MKPGKTYFPAASITSASGRRLDVALDARDRFAFAENIGDVTLAAGNDFAALDQE